MHRYLMQYLVWCFVIFATCLFLLAGEIDAGPGKSVGTYSAKTPEDKQVLETARKFVNANSSDVRYRLEIGKKTGKYALVNVIPLQELDPAMVILEKVGNKWVARDMGTLLEEWMEKVPELFK